jgi:hypothetical protein
MRGGLAVPITFHNYDVGAFYFSKIRPEKIGFGIVHRFMTPQEVQQIGTNKAAVVEFVRRGIAVEAIIAANPQLSNPMRLYPGDKVNLPKAAGAPTPAQ